MKSKASKYGRRKVCTSCHNHKQRQYAQRPENREKIKIQKREAYRNGETLERRRQFKLIEGFDKPLRCYFCGGVITRLEGHAGESLNIRSLDWNHDNWHPSNKVPAHLSCHMSYHNSTRREVALQVLDKMGYWVEW